MSGILDILKQWCRNSCKHICVCLIVVSLAIVFRTFVFAKYSISTPSMEPSIQVGDQVIVSKFTPGARLIYNFLGLKYGEKPRMYRIPGFAVKRNDILIFNFPYSDWNHLSMNMSKFYAKRCVAIPGDTFYIDNGFFKVNQMMDTLGCYMKQQELSQKRKEDFDSYIFNCFPLDDRYSWNIKTFGPLYVPKRNDTLPIDTLNIALYLKLIEYETNQVIAVKGKSVFMGDSLISSYTFTKNYYFMAGDHVFDSQDSRYWGLLPEDHIVGKVAFVWNSYNKGTGKISWTKFLRSVN